MFSNYVPALYIYLLCSAACPGALAEPWEQRVKQLETELQRVNQLLEKCSSNVELIDEIREEISVMKESADDFSDEITRKVDDVNTKVDDVNTKVDDVTTNMTDIRDVITDIKESSVSMTDIGTSYIRWGRRSCPLGEDRVYSGIMSGAYINYHSGVNYQCLPLDPEYGNYLDGRQLDGDLIYGAQYGGHPDDIYDMDNLVGTTFLDQDVPCSLCHTTNRTTVHMFPAKTQCPVGWTQEYWGYLVSSYYAGSNGVQTTFECVDNAPEVLIDGTTNVPAAQIYNVEVFCENILPCGPYVDGWELTCVVCSK